MIYHYKTTYNAASYTINSVHDAREMVANIPGGSTVTFKSGAKQSSSVFSVRILVEVIYTPLRTPLIIDACTFKTTTDLSVATSFI